MRCHMPRYCDLAKEPKKDGVLGINQALLGTKPLNAHFLIKVTQTDKYADVYTNYFSHSNTQTE
jgi:hypothetical protein